MSKEAFLTELAGHLKVLEEREQQDILDEYAQHIDMKIQNGMSEEEAIRDFGPVKELAAEILEAYHVNPEYGDSSRRVKMDFESAAQSAEQGIRSAGSFLKRAGKKLGQWISEACAWIGKPIHKKPAGEPVEQPEGAGSAARQWTAADGGDSEKSKVGYGPAVSQKADARSEQGILGKLIGFCRDILKGCGSLIGSAARVLRKLIIWLRHICWDLLRWGVRLCWNVFWFCAAVCLGLGTIAAIFCFGALLILCFQGYPLIGVTWISLGGLLCGGALTCASWGLIRRKKTEEKTAVPENEDDTYGEPEAGDIEEKEPDEDDFTDEDMETEEDEHDQIS